MSKQSFRIVQKLFLMVFSATTILISAALAQSPAQSAPPAGRPVTQAPSRNLPPLPANRAHMYYALVWGIESPSVKAVESGEIIRFSYHVLDPTRAKILNDKSVDPALIDPEKGVKLVVPSLEQVGML